MWTIFKVFIEFVTILLLFYVLFFFVFEACGILAPLPGIKLRHLALEGEVLTTGPPGKPQELPFLLKGSCFYQDAFFAFFDFPKGSAI